MHMKLIRNFSEARHHEKTQLHKVQQALRPCNEFTPHRPWGPIATWPKPHCPRPRRERGDSLVLALTMVSGEHGFLESSTRAPLIHMGLQPEVTPPMRPSKPRSQAKVDCGLYAPGRVCADLLWPENTTQVKFQDHKTQGEIKDDQKKSSEMLNLSPAYLKGSTGKGGEAECKTAAA